MSKSKKDRVIHVENLVIHAKNVDIIRENEPERRERRSPWESFWGRPILVDNEGVEPHENHHSELEDEQENEHQN